MVIAFYVGIAQFFYFTGGTIISQQSKTLLHLAEKFQLGFLCGCYMQTHGCFISSSSSAFPLQNLKLMDDYPIPCTTIWSWYLRCQDVIGPLRDSCLGALGAKGQHEADLFLMSLYIPSCVRSVWSLLSVTSSSVVSSPVRLTYGHMRERILNTK